MLISDWSSDVCSSDLSAAAATVALLLEEAATRDATARSGDPASPWGTADGWRLGHAGQRRLVLRRADTRHDITAHGADGQYRIEHDDSTTVVAGARLAGPHLADTGLSRSEAHPSELHSLMCITYAVVRLKKKNKE